MPRSSFADDLLHASFRNRCEPPFVLSRASLACLRAPTHVLVGAHDRLFDAARLIARARAVLPELRSAEILPDVGHGLEASRSTAARVLELLTSTPSS